MKKTLLLKIPTINQGVNEIVNYNFHPENYKEIQDESFRFQENLIAELSELDNEANQGFADFDSQAQELAIVQEGDERFREIFPNAEQFNYDEIDDPVFFAEPFQNIKSSINASLNFQQNPQDFLAETDFGEVANQLLQNNNFGLLDKYMPDLKLIDISAPLSQSMADFSKDLIENQLTLDDATSNPGLYRMYEYNFPPNFIGQFDKQLFDVISDRFSDVVQFSPVNIQYGLMFTGQCEGMTMYEALELKNFLEVSTALGDPVVFLQILNMLVLLNRTLLNNPQNFDESCSEFLFFLKICSEANPDQDISEILNDLLRLMSTTHRGVRRSLFLYYFMSITYPRYVKHWE